MAFTPREIRLLVLSAITVLASILMALCIGTVLPMYMKNDAYVKDDSNITTLFYNCRCPPKVNVSETRKMYQGEQVKLDKIRHRRSVQCANEGNGLDIKKFPFLASLSLPRYSDDKTDRTVICSGAIISNQHVLTGSKCLARVEEWRELQVRVGSIYWYSHGFVYGVKKVIFHEKNDALIVQVDGYISFDNSVNKVFYTQANWNIAFSVGWNRPHAGDESSVFNAFTVDTWHKSYCENCSKGILTYCEHGSSGKILVLNNALVGLQCKTYGPYEFVFQEIKSLFNFSRKRNKMEKAVFGKISSPCK